MEPMVRCPHCGLYHTSATEYCPEKGLPIYAQKPVEIHSKRNLLWLAIVLVLVILAACVVLAIFLVPRFITPKSDNSNQIPINVPTLTLAPLLTRLPAEETPNTFLPSETVAPSATQAPTATITPWQACPDSPYPSQLQVGMRASVALDPPLPNRIRKKADINSSIVGYVDPGGEVEILEGPACSGGWTWWRVQQIDGPLTGWTAEGDKDGYWLIPLP